MITNEKVDILIDRRDDKLAEIVKLMCYDDYSIKDIAKELGISNAYAYLKLKKLKDKKQIKELFGR